MGFKLNIKGSNDEFNVEQENIISVKFISDTQDSSNARSTDLSIGLEIEGKIIPSIGQNDIEDNTRKLLLWSLVSAEDLEAYKSITLEVVLAGNVVRKFLLSNAFLVDYNEYFDEKNGNGLFFLKIKQKKEKIKDIVIEGGYQK
ncbi:hypothetical protein STFE110948_04840 [Streptobacillus felis]|uniref:Membrane-associated protease 1 n=1 Tax=Streptobacillus felis TaxID=1384509 RepID=A0A7Z0TAK8_9FUSO|nr:hypothetical protein [Streptobacillus felis]NYV28117.1 hypothetical protein [Streptobacillus felis]